MRTVLAITRKELEQYFASPIAYVVIALLFSNIWSLFLYLSQPLCSAICDGTAQYGGEGAGIIASDHAAFFR